MQVFRSLSVTSLGAPAIVVLILCALLLSGCARVDTEVPSKTGRTEEAKKAKPLVIGLIPEQQIFAQVERYEPLARYLSGKIGKKVKVVILPRYGNIADAFVSQGLDGAFLGSFSYILAHERHGVEILVRPEDHDGTSTYHGLVMVRKDSGITTAKQLRGKRFAFVDKETTAGYLLPLSFFRKSGIRDYRNYFKETYFAGTHEDVIMDVLNGKADAGAAKNTVFERLAARDRRLAAELLILAKSPDVPENGLAVRTDLDGKIRENIRESLLNMHNDPSGREVLNSFGANRFIATTDRDYEPVYQYVKEIGLDLSTYSSAN